MFLAQISLPSQKFRPTISDSLVQWTVVHQSLIQSRYRSVHCPHKTVDPPVHRHALRGPPQDRCHVRQFRYMGLEQWGVGFIIGLLPVLLSVSLGIFLVGLVLFLVPLQTAIASIVGTITFVTFAIYFITNVLPVWYPSCPYKTPLSQYIFLSYAYIIRLITLVSSALTPTKPPPRKFRDVERAAVELRADDLDVYALGWLSNMSLQPQCTEYRHPIDQRPYRYVQ